MPETLHSPTRPKALVVDDHEDSARTLEMVLQGIGYETDIAFDGIDGLRKANELQPDIILLDISIPRLDGYDTCRVIRAQPWASDVRIIAVTGWAIKDLPLRTDEAGFDGYLRKPVEFTELENITKSR